MGDVLEFKLLVAQDDRPGSTPVTTGDNAESATTTTPGVADPTGTQAPAKPPSAWPILLPLILIMVFMFWTSSSAQRKEKKKRDSMLSALKRHDRVQTIGGVIGSVVEIKDSEIVLKVDETNNVKMRFSRSAVQQVLDSRDTEVVSASS